MLGRMSQQTIVVSPSTNLAGSGAAMFISPGQSILDVRLRGDRFKTARALMCSVNGSVQPMRLKMALSAVVLQSPWEVRNKLFVNFDHTAIKTVLVGRRGPCSRSMLPRYRAPHRGRLSLWLIFLAKIWWWPLLFSSFAPGGRHLHS